MMPKKIVLGPGTLTFTNPLSKRDIVYKVTAFQIDQPSTDVERVCGYDPQLLLTDQRSAEKKIADAVVGQFRILFPSVIDWAKEHAKIDPSSYAAGGVYSGLMPRLYPYQEEMMASIMERGTEFVIPTGTGRHRGYAPDPQDLPPERDWRPRHREIVQTIDVDYSGIEDRILRTLDGKRDVLFNQWAKTEGMSAAFRKASELVAQFHENRIQAAVTNAMLAAYIKMPPRKFLPKRAPMKPAARLRYLLNSRDPRQRKRGARVALRNYRRSFPMSLSSWGGPGRGYFAYDEIDNYERPPEGEYQGWWSGRKIDPTRYQKD